MFLHLSTFKKIQKYYHILNNFRGFYEDSFFGVGAVCSVMATLLDELSNKSKQKRYQFVFVVKI